MIATTSGPDLEYFDARQYTLMLTVRADTGLVEIQHQAGSDGVADRQMARLAAEIIDALGPHAVINQLGADDLRASDLRPHAIDPPRRGTAVMRCRCGRMLDLRDMHRYEPPRDVQLGCVVVRPIVCFRCAA